MRGPITAGNWGLLGFHGSGIGAVVLALVGAPPAYAQSPPTTASPPSSATAGPTAVSTITPFADSGMLLDARQAFAFLRVVTSADTAGSATPSATAGAAVGITNHIVLDGSFGTISFGHQTTLRSPEVGLWVGLLDKPSVEVDVQGHVAFSTEGGFPIERAEPGALGIFRLWHLLRLDLGLSVSAVTNPVHTVGVHVPASVAVQLAPYVYAQMNSGFLIEACGHPQWRASVPIGFALGTKVLLSGGGSVVVVPSVEWPDLLAHGAGPQNPPPGPFSVGLTLALVTASP